MKKLKIGIVLVILTGAMSLGLGGCDSSGGEQTIGTGETEQQRIQRITQELIQRAQACGQNQCGTNHTLAVNGGHFSDTSPENLQAMAQLVAQCRLDDMRQINHREHQNGNPMKNMQFSGNFAFQPGTFLLNGLGVNPGVTSRSNPNAPSTNEFASGTAHGTAGGSLGARSLEH